MAEQRIPGEVSHYIVISEHQQTSDCTDLFAYYRSKIQGLGLYAARDLEKHTMVIEYIGEVIRSELSELREKQYEAKVN